MGVASWLLILLGLLMGPGQSGVLALTEGWVTVPSCTVVWVVGCLVLGVEDTLTAGGLLRLLWSWWSAGWWVLPCVLVCVWGWHAVGVLGQCALGCPARPGFHFLGFWVGVGGLVVNCIVDASILL